MNAHYKLGRIRLSSHSIYSLSLFYLFAWTRGFSVVPVANYDVNVDLDTCGNYAASDAKNITCRGDPA